MTVIDPVNFTKPWDLARSYERVQTIPSRMASCAASVSSSVDKAQQFGPQRVQAASDLEHARKMVMAR